MWRAISSGIDYSLPGNGGPDCLAYSSAHQRLLEFVFVLVATSLEILWVYPRLKYPPDGQDDDDEDIVDPRDKDNVVDSSSKSAAAVLIRHRDRITAWRRILTACLCLIYGAQVSYKVASYQLIYLLNPCHVTTLTQIYLLFSIPRGKLTTFVFRLHFYMLNGATLAIFFPVVNTLKLPYEIELYYIQHISLLLIPIYLLSSGGSFSMEEFFDFRWPVLMVASWFLYHILVLLPIGWYTMANLDNLLCPAISDPFRGPYYRIWAFLHQSIFIPAHGKLYGLTVKSILAFLGQSPLSEKRQHQAAEIPAKSHVIKHKHVKYANEVMKNNLHNLRNNNNSLHAKSD